MDVPDDCGEKVSRNSAAFHFSEEDIFHTIAESRRKLYGSTGIFKVAFNVVAIKKNGVAFGEPEENFRILLPKE